MKDVFYSQLAKCISEANDNSKVISAETNQIQKEDVRDLVDRIMELGAVGKKGGLLEIERRMISENYEKRYPDLFWFMDFVINAVDPDVIEDIGIERMISNSYSGYRGLLYLISLKGARCIQSAFFERRLAESIISMIPDDIAEPLREKYCIWRKETDPKEMIEQLRDDPMPISDDDRDYFLLKTVDSCIDYLDDRSIQRWLREVINDDLVIVMKGMSGKFKYAILKNISLRIGTMIMEDMEFMGPVRTRTIAERARKIFTTLLKLIKADEITTDKADSLLVFCEIFGIDSDNEYRHDPETAQRMIEEYLEEDKT